ncbi:hypothetical protein FOZ60_008187 [Perkinsus olseni]|uniref:Cilia- and flagella-associated protein 206 n=1 Tax=Perkinsus olseni TaxID=32597 RepID=A0A7J6NJQ6_PEROL|nr:hypothetical protein FOZ60_008187 [Perkinsus olseni]
MKIDEDVEQEVRREVSPALFSVMPRTAVQSFCSLGINEKVLGDSDNCRKADDVEARLGEINGKIAQLGEHIARLLFASLVSKKEGSGDCEHPEHLSQFAEDICYLRQCTVYLQSIQEDIERALGRLYNSRTQFAECMKLIDVGIGARTVVSKEEVYPRFDSLTKYYTSCRDELHFIDDRIQLAQMVLDQLSGYRGISFSAPSSHPLKNHSEAVGVSIVAGRMSLKDQSEGVPAEEEPSSDETGGMVLLEPGSFGDYQETKLKYQGYCPIAIVDGGGLLIPGDPQTRPSTTGGRGRVSRSVLISFMADRAGYEEGVKAYCRLLPPLIPLLQMQTEFPNVPFFLSDSGEFEDKLIRKDSSSGQVRMDAACETDLHPVRHVDKEYEWNEWRLRERLLRAASLRQKRTRSIQTNNSAFRRDSDAQVYLPKDVTTNTYHDKWTNPVVHKRYLVGMRGAKEKSLKSVEIKFDM